MAVFHLFDYIDVISELIWGIDHISMDASQALEQSYGHVRTTDCQQGCTWRAWDSGTNNKPHKKTCTVYREPDINTIDAEPLSSYWRKICLRNIAFYSQKYDTKIPLNLIWGAPEV